MAVYDKLKELNITLAAPATPAAAYVMYVQTGNLVFISGHIAKNADGNPNTGLLGKDKTTEQGKQAARSVAINSVSQRTSRSTDFSRAISNVCLLTR